MYMSLSCGERLLRQDRRAEVRLKWVNTTPAKETMEKSISLLFKALEYHLKLVFRFRACLLVQINAAPNRTFFVQLAMSM